MIIIKCKLQKRHLYMLYVSNTCIVTSYIFTHICVYTTYTLAYIDIYVVTWDRRPRKV